MKNWKISRLRITAFKAFSDIEFDFERCSLLTLEGPNGYGKTTIFDAIELLLTGQINRLSELFSTVMDAKKTNYKDNLYWNSKDDAAPIEIRVELIDEITKNIRCFSRSASVADLKVEANNRADRFQIFKLFSVDTFKDGKLLEELPSNYLDQFFGENFCKNYSMLNYLRQGQNNFIFGRKAKARKESLDDLLQTKRTREFIELCGKAEKRLASHVSAPEQEKIADLEAKIDALAKAEAPDNIAIKYEKISTAVVSPVWDLIDPFPVADQDRFDTLSKEVKVIISLLALKDAVRERKRNEDIEKFLAEKDRLIQIAVSIGKHASRYDSLSIESKRINSLLGMLTTLKKLPSEININDLHSLREGGISIDVTIDAAVAVLAEIVAKLDDRASQVVRISQLRSALDKEHRHVFGEEGNWCALCGTPWQTINLLDEAISLTQKTYDDVVGVLSERIASQEKIIADALLAVRSKVESDLELAELVFDKPLFEELQKNLSQFAALSNLNDRLELLGIDYDGGFTTDETELVARKLELIDKIRGLKNLENDSLPDGWDKAIDNTFAALDDFYSADSTKFEEKQNYLSLAYRLSQSKALSEAKRLHRELANKFLAASAAKEKISTLKKIISNEERSHSSKVISEIELIFHIYSGRLIQNYQRGLGLFIDQGSNDKLQFCTAEYSDHDATLSMSSGQLSALSLAFFLALNRVYSKTPVLLIDDPVQSLDEINIASLTDLLRCELRDRQLIISTHEDDIAAYMRYRYLRAGLESKRFHMQSYLNGRVNFQKDSASNLS